MGIQSGWSEYAEVHRLPIALYNVNIELLIRDISDNVFRAAEVWRNMTRKGLVREVKGDEALICPTDGNECDSCEAKHACLSLSGGKERNTDFWMPNDLGASPGDLVELELRSSASLTIIASTFLLPVFLLFAGYLFMMDGTDLHRALGAGAGLLAGIVSAIVINKRLGAKKGYNMQMTKILERAETDTAGRITSGTELEGNNDD